MAIALGSSLRDREAVIVEAVRRLSQAGVTVERVSSLYETAPVGIAAATWFLNAACVGRTGLVPEALHARVRELEQALGREPGRGLRPRVIDLDIILYGQRILRSRDLVLPHPRFRERAFVLLPLLEVAPDWVDPVTGRTVAELARLVDSWDAGVRRHAPPPKLT